MMVTYQRADVWNADDIRAITDNAGSHSGSVPIVAQSSVARVLAYALAGGNPYALTGDDVRVLSWDGAGELSHHAHVHPQRDTLGSMCPVCDPETFARVLLSDSDDEGREFASAYRVNG